MYQLGAMNKAAEFFKDQEDLASSKTQRAVMEAQSMRAESLFKRQQDVQSITDNTLRNLTGISQTGGRDTTGRAIEDLAMDSLQDSMKPGGIGNINSKVGKTPPIAIQEVQTEPVDLNIGQMADRIGNTLMKAGYGAEGMAYVKEGVEYAQKVMEAEEARADAQIKKSERFVKVADYVYEGLADVRSQEDQDNFFGSLPREMIEALGVENVQQMMQVPYDPEVIEYYRDKTLSTKETYDLNLKAERVQLQADRDAAMAFDRAARNKIAEQARKDRAFAAANRAKNSGKNSVTVAQPNEISQARKQVIASVFKGVVPKAGSPDAVIIDAASASIATEAKQMAKENPGLTYDEALTRAVTLHRGDFIKPLETVKTQSYLFGSIPVPGTKGTRQKPGQMKFEPLGATKARPITVKSRENVKLVPGRWYKGPSGEVKQYNPE